MTKNPLKTYMRGHAPKSIETRLKMSKRKYKGAKTPDSHGYLRVFYGVSGKTTKEQRLIAENVLGRKLEVKNKVHHVNEIITDNRKCNLVICEDQAYHLFFASQETRFR